MAVLEDVGLPSFAMSSQGARRWPARSGLATSDGETRVAPTPRPKALKRDLFPKCDLKFQVPSHLRQGLQLPSLRVLSDQP